MKFARSASPEACSFGMTISYPPYGVQESGGSPRVHAAVVSQPPGRARVQGNEEDRTAGVAQQEPGEGTRDHPTLAGRESRESSRGAPSRCSEDSRRGLRRLRGRRVRLLWRSAHGVPDARPHQRPRRGRARDQSQAAPLGRRDAVQAPPQARLPAGLPCALHQLQFRAGRLRALPTRGGDA